MVRPSMSQTQMASGDRSTMSRYRADSSIKPPGTHDRARAGSREPDRPATCSALACDAVVAVGALEPQGDVVGVLAPVGAHVLDLVGDGLVLRVGLGGDDLGAVARAPELLVLAEVAALGLEGGGGAGPRRVRVAGHGREVVRDEALHPGGRRRRLRRGGGGGPRRGRLRARVGLLL